VVGRKNVNLLGDCFVVLECLRRTRFGLRFPDTQRADMYRLLRAQCRDLVNLNFHGLRDVEEVEARRRDHVRCSEICDCRRQWWCQSLIRALRGAFSVEYTASRRRLVTFAYDVQIHVPLLECLFKRRGKVMPSLDNKAYGLRCIKRAQQSAKCSYDDPMSAPRYIVRKMRMVPYRMQLSRQAR
jgi:hypothetical protein